MYKDGNNKPSGAINRYLHLQYEFSSARLWLWLDRSWRRNGVTAANGRPIWAVRWVEVRVEQQEEPPHWFWASSSLWRQPTAVMRAAPFPLPSSDSRKLTSHLGASSFTVCRKIREKLEKVEEKHFSYSDWRKKLNALLRAELNHLQMFKGRSHLDL